MPTLSRSDLESMAKEIVNKFLSGSSLEDEILKSSKDGLLNSEQIKRLTELSNTAAFLDMFNGKTGDDRMVEFNVADPSAIIKKYYSSDIAGDNPAKGVVSIEIEDLDPSDNDHSIFFDDVVGDRYDNSNIPDEASENGEDEFKLASLEKVAEEYASSQHKFSLGSMDEFRVQDIKNSLMDKIAHYNYVASDLADEVANTYKGIYSRSKHAEFELGAFSRHGNAAIPALQMVRDRLGMPKIARALSSQELSLIADRHLVESSTSLTKIAEIIDNASKLITAEAALKKVGKRI
jgi:hypothetical protein